MRNTQKKSPTAATGDGCVATYDQQATLEELARKGNIEAIRMLKELEKEAVLNYAIAEKFGIKTPPKSNETL
jgi:phage host-nuclease inhibitor protein Gam